jgi:hypothetical protein
MEKDIRSGAESKNQRNKNKTIVDAYYINDQKKTTDSGWQDEKLFFDEVSKKIGKSNLSDHFQKEVKKTSNKLKESPFFSNQGQEKIDLFNRDISDMLKPQFKKDFEQIHQYLSSKNALEKIAELTSQSKNTPRSTGELMVKVRQSIKKLNDKEIQQTTTDVVMPMIQMAEIGLIMTAYLPSSVIKEVNQYLGYELCVATREKRSNIHPDHLRHFGGVADFLLVLTDKKNEKEIIDFVKGAISLANKSLNNKKMFNGMDRQHNEQDVTTVAATVAEMQTEEVFEDTRRQGFLRQVFSRLYALLISMARTIVRNAPATLQIILCNFIFIFVWELVRSSFGQLFVLNMLSTNSTNTNGVTHIFDWTSPNSWDALREGGDIDLVNNGRELINLSLYIGFALVSFIPILKSFIRDLTHENLNRYNLIGYTSMSLLALGSAGMNLVGYTGAFSHIPGLGAVRFRKNISDMLAVTTFLGGRFICEHLIIYRYRSAGRSLEIASVNALMYGVLESTVVILMSGGVSDMGLNRIAQGWVLYRAIGNFTAELVYNWLTSMSDFFGEGSAGRMDILPARVLARTARADAADRNLRSLEVRIAGRMAILDYSSARWFAFGLNWVFFNVIFSTGLSNIAYVATVYNMENTWLNFFILTVIVAAHITVPLFSINLLDVRALTRRRLPQSSQNQNANTATNNPASLDVVVHSRDDNDENDEDRHNIVSTRF